MTKTEKLYATMAPWRLFFVVALPGMISMLAMSIYNIIEGMFIGQRLGEGAFAAVNIAFPLIMINFSLADLVGVGASVPISIALGKGDRKTANNIFSCSVILIFLASLLMGCVMLFAAEPLARFMGADDSVLDTAVRYIQTYAVCSPITTIFFAMDNYLRISGYVKTSMLINIFCNLSTLCLLLVFLLGLGMDVTGSALATCLSMCLCSVLALIPFLRGRALLQFTRPRFSLAMLREIGACGSPVFLSNIAGRVTSILMNISLMTLGAAQFGAGGGTTAVAAYAVLMYASDMCQPLLYGMSDALSPAIGFNWGAGDRKRVRQIATCGYVGAALVGIAATAVMFFLAGPVASLFVEAGDLRLLTLASHALRIFCTAYLIRWFIICTQSFLSAMEKPVHATVLSVSIAVVFPVLALGALWPLRLDGIWLNMLVTALLATLLGIFLLRHAWKKRETSTS